MPAVERPGRKGVYLELEEEFLAQVKELAERNRRTFKDEVRHALERHLAMPPALVTPALEPATVEPSPERARPKRRRR